MQAPARGAQAKLWPLGSGSWRAGAGPEAGFALQASALGHDCGTPLPAPDLRLWLDAGCATGFPDALYPPEFRHSPFDGRALQRTPLPPGTPWVPPFGAPVSGARGAAATRGLHQCARPLRLASAPHRSGQDDPERALALPPHGRHEFLSLRAATAAQVLLALDPDQGTLHAHLPHSDRWETLAPPHGAPLAEAGLPRADWRCEVLDTPLGSRLFLPTQEGLACVEPDAPALHLALRYLGDAPALGAPILFADRVWLPLRPQANGAPCLLGVEPQDLDVLRVAFQDTLPPALGRVHTPVSGRRWALWPCQAGQLLLQHRADGSFQTAFLPWPAGLRPVFDCGSPYLRRDASLWQLCSETETGRYEYVQLGRADPERHPAMPPRSCSGTLSFRFAARQQRDPWLEPESGDDSRADDQLLPLLESPGGVAFVGLRWQTTESLPQWLAGTGRLETLLLLEDETGEHHLYQRSLSAPWQLRVFVHDATLWASHPELGTIPGWRLTA